MYHRYHCVCTCPYTHRLYEDEEKKTCKLCAQIVATHAHTQTTAATRKNTRKFTLTLIHKHIDGDMKRVCDRVDKSRQYGTEWGVRGDEKSDTKVNHIEWLTANFNKTIICSRRGRTRSRTMNVMCVCVCVPRGCALCAYVVYLLYNILCAFCAFIQCLSMNRSNKHYIYETSKS